MKRSEIFLRGPAAFILWGLLLLSGACGSPAVNPSQTTCAIIADPTDAEPAKAAFVSLLEARLSKSGRIALVERAEVQKILKEHELKLLLSPEGGGERAEVGRLLKADLLLLVRFDKKEGVFCDLVVSDAAIGLRLVVRGLPSSMDDEQKLLEIEKLLDQALAKRAETIQEICAVPPFVSEDLTHQYDYLQGSYSKLVEQLLLSQNGVMVVELAESQAIANERGLTADGPASARKLPLYFLGKFRGNGIGENRKVAVTLELHRGQELLDTAKQQELKSEEVGGWLQKATLKMFGNASLEKKSVSATGSESKELAERALEFMKIGNWDEALALTEASLLLNPDQPEFEFHAASLASELTREHLNQARAAWGRKKESDEGARAMTFYRLALEHVERVLRNPGTHYNVELHNLLAGFKNTPRDLMRPEIKGKLTDEMRTALDEGESKINEMLAGCAEQSAREGKLDNHLLGMLSGLSCGYWYRFPLGASDWVVDDNFKGRLRIINALPIQVGNLKKNISSFGFKERWTRELAGSSLSPALKKQPEYRRFLEQVKAIPDPEISETATKLIAETFATVSEQNTGMTSKHETKQAAVKTSAETSFANRVSLTPIHFTFEDALAIPSPYPKTSPIKMDQKISGWIKCPGNVDFVCGLVDGFVMKEKGKLRRLFNVKTYLSEGVCFDGKFAWVPERLHESRMLVVDPIRETVAVFTPQDGLPPIDQVVVLPLSPGRIFASGVLNRTNESGIAPVQRSWCGILSLGADGKKLVEVFHEARVNSYVDRVSKGREGGYSSDWEKLKEDLSNDPSVAYRPLEAIKLRDAETKKEKILLFRSILQSAEAKPLLIDLDAKSVSIADVELGGNKGGRVGPVVEFGGAAYWITPDPDNDSSFTKPHHASLWSLALPQMKKKMIVQKLEEGGSLFVHDGKLHYLAKNWWVMDGVNGSMVKIADNVPGRPDYQTIGDSNHYGFVLMRDGVQQVSIDEAKH